MTKDLEYHTSKSGHYFSDHEAPKRLLSMVEKWLEEQVRDNNLGNTGEKTYT